MLKKNLIKNKRKFNQKLKNVKKKFNQKQKKV
jgi:hypothetical protein